MTTIHDRLFAQYDVDSIPEKKKGINAKAQEANEKTFGLFTSTLIVKEKTYSVNSISALKFAWRTCSKNTVTFVLDILSGRWKGKLQEYLSKPLYEKNAEKMGLSPEGVKKINEIFCGNTPKQHEIEDQGNKYLIIRAEKESKTQGIKKHAYVVNKNKPLGAGATKQVFKALEVSKGVFKALALPVKGARRQFAEGSNHEWALYQDLKKADVPHLPKLHKYTTGTTSSFMVMDLMEGDLLDAFNNDTFNADEIPILAKDLLETLYKLHNHAHRCHLDLKFENVLVRKKSDGKAEYCISDYEYCSKNKTSLNESVGTAAYMAPEILQLGRKKTNQVQVNPSQDMWSLGVLLYHAKYDKLPFDDESKKGPIVKASHGDFNPFEKSLEKLKQDHASDIQSDPIAKLIFSCLKIEPEKRITADKALEELNEYLSSKKR